MNFLASHSSEEFTLSDLVTRLEINLASAHALLAALTDSGYVVRHPRLRTYSLGPSVVALGSAALECHPAIDHARDEARRLSEKLDLGVAVTAQAGDEIVFLARVGEHRPRDIDSFVGQRIPMEPPVGAVFMAWQDPRRWLDRAADPVAMEAVLEEVRIRGWAFSVEDRIGVPAPEYRAFGSLDSDRTYDVVMITAPVFNPAAHSSVAITLLGLPPELTAEAVTTYGEAVRDAGLVATRASGGRVPRRPA